MSGFDNAKVLCNLGCGDPNTPFSRLPRLPFNAACSLL